LDPGALAGAFVIAGEPAFLILGVNGVGIFRIDLRAEAIAALGNEPIGVGDAGRARGARWSADIIVVLRTAIHKIKRQRIVYSHVVKLRQRQVALIEPVGAAV